MIASILADFVLAPIAAALYLLPVLVGLARRVPDIGSVAVINILLGWTLVGWVLALALALRSVRPASPVIQVVQNLPPSRTSSASPSPGGPPPVGWTGMPGTPAPHHGLPPVVFPPPSAGSAEAADRMDQAGQE